MRTSSQLLLTFLLNACWQIALIVALASFGSWLLRHSARYQHWLWVAALCLSLLVPVTTAVRSAPLGAPVEVQPSYEIENPVLTDNTIPFSSPSTVSAWSIQLSAGLTLALFIAYGICLVYGSLRLAQAWRTTRNIRNAAVDVERDETIEAIIRECAKRLNFRNQSVIVCRSATLPAPVTIGLFRPVIILPDSLLREGDSDLLTSAIGHEYIHVARHDYVLNFIYELLYLPVSFHPAAALVRRRIKQTRELCCDELVAERILSAETYARSLVVLAGSAPSLRRLSVTTTVGIADADILEARVMSLLSKPKMNKRWKRMLLVAVSLLLVIPCVAAAALAMRFEVATNAQEPSQQQTKERERREEKEKREAITRERGEEAFTEKMQSDPKFREEVERKRELESEMREVRQAALVRLARISMDQAIQIATSQSPGKVLLCSLEATHWEEPGKLAKDGVVFYHVMIGNESAPGATHVWVNAVDGSIIKTEKELPRKTRSEN